MKVIFLDHDGVICLHENWGTRSGKRKRFLSKNPESPLPVEVRFDNFDKKSIKVLNSILEKTGADIVVSSDWKLHATLDEMGNYYEQQGIIKKPIAFTQNLSDFDQPAAGLYSWKGWLERARSLEIKKYLSDNPIIEKWVSVDDLPMGKDYLGEGGLDNFVICRRSREGIKQLGLEEKIISFLN
jgi:hypothetical protein